MLLLGHVGITLGTVAVLNRAWAPSPFLRTENPAAVSTPVDYRLVILGSLLPDLIDKPLGMFILGDVFSSGRIFGHSLLFLLAFTLVGAYLWRRYGKSWGLVLAASWSLHLVFDSMWAFPATLYWPLLGWDFHRFDMAHWLSRIFHSWLTRPDVILQESLGAAIIAGLAIRLVAEKRVHSFIRTGAMD